MRTISDIWARLFVYESNLLTFGAGYNVGHPHWDNHYSALLYAVKQGEAGKIAYLDRVHFLLSRDNDKFAGQMRTTFSGSAYPQSSEIRPRLDEWHDSVLDSLDMDSFKVESEGQKRARLLHYQLVNIRPFSTDNERFARIMAVNLCLFAEVDPIMFLYEDKTHYEAGLQFSKKL